MVVDSANFQADLGADSLDIVELVMDFEKEFGIEIPDDDAGDNIVTVADAIATVPGSDESPVYVTVKGIVGPSLVNQNGFYTYLK